MDGGFWHPSSIGVSPFIEVKRKSILPGAFLLVAIAVFFSHFMSLGMGSSWLTKAAIILSAATAISERGEIGWILKILKLCVLIQIPIIVCQILNIQVPWISAGQGFPGSLYKRGALSIFSWDSQHLV